MTDQAMPRGGIPPTSDHHPLHAGSGGLITKLGPFVAFAVLGIGAAYACFALVSDLEGGPSNATAVYLLLGLALLIALGFEFVNGFHDTANAVATVIYTNSMPAHMAVVWSGCFNFLGVMVSSGAVAFGIISLLPVELILQVGSNAGFAMVFALLLAAILWNLGTWYYGIPNSSSHALIGSIIGVGLMNQLLAPANSGTSGVDWDQALGVGKSLLFSPLAGFFVAGLMLLLARFLLRIPALYKPPVGKEPPPWWIRGLLIFTCTGVSFFHGGNDGQKGMGLIMLILIGAAPTAYALNRTMPQSATPAFVSAATAAQGVFAAHAGGMAAPAIGQARATVGDALGDKTLNRPEVFAGLSVLSANIANNVKNYGALSHVPAAATQI